MSAAVQVSTLKPDIGEGAYRVAAVSGLLTGVAAKSATAGHLFAVRWSPSAAAKIQYFVLQRLRVAMTTISGYTAAQEFGIDLSILRSYTASHTGGTAIDLSGHNNAKRTSFAASAVTDMRIGTTGALTAGTHTIDAQPIAADQFSEKAAAATVLTGFAEVEIDNEDLDRYPIVLAPNEGLLVRNTILQGAGGTARLVVEMDWLEVVRY